MMFLTARVDLKKIAVILGAIAAVTVALILLFGGTSEVQTTAAPVTDNDGRVGFLTAFGWDVTNSPTESGQVRIPEAATEVFDRYNSLQKSQGYDLTRYAGKNVMRYVYKVNNYPGATEPVYATVLIYKGQVIGGDITDTAPGGKVQGFKMVNNSSPATPTETAPASA